MADPYHGLAADYDWIFDDGALAGGAAISRPAIARLLDRVGPGRDVLDAACGTGNDAAVLARRGFSVRAADGSAAMVAALTGLRQMARPGGYVVIDSRNWEKLHAEHRIVQVMDRVRVRGGRRCLVLYAWEIPERFDQEHLAHLVFLFQDDSGRVEPREYQLSFRPFTLTDLRKRLGLAGLREVGTDYDEAADRYAIITVPT